MKRKDKNKSSIEENSISSESKEKSKKVEKIEILKQGKKLDESEVKNNLKYTRKMLILTYILPLIISIIIALIYLFTQKNFLLIPFAIFVLVVLFGADSTSRVCPSCKKWNSVTVIKHVSKTKVIKEKSKGMFNKKKIREKEK